MQPTTEPPIKRATVASESCWPFPASRDSDAPYAWMEECGDVGTVVAGGARVAGDARVPGRVSESEEEPAEEETKVDVLHIKCILFSLCTL